MRVIISDRAQAELDDILLYIAERNPSAASRMATRFKAALASLDLFPNRARPGFAAGTRELTTVYPYSIVYEVRAEVVEILRIWHGAQDRSPDIP